MIENWKIPLLMTFLAGLATVLGGFITFFVNKNNMIKISYILPCYNIERFVADCLDSLYNQGLPESEFEIICVNDCSPDNSLAILEEYASRDERIKILKQQNAGAGVARK